MSDTAGSQKNSYVKKIKIDTPSQLQIADFLFQISS